jgi:acetolactate synthase-1/2/3 large subunit
MSSDSTVAQAILRTLGQAGVRTAFGLPGVHNLAFWRSVDDSGPAIMGVRHEQTTVYAADGLARASGGLGVALTTTGPGAANAAGAFGEAAASGSPVVLLASDISTAIARAGVMRGALHETRDQAAIFEPLAKAVFRPRTAESAIAAVAEAAELALTWPRGPVYLDVPTDVLDRPALPITPAAPRRRVPQSGQLAAAVELIARSGRVVIWAGGGVVQADAEPELVELAERLCAPVVTTFAGRGVLPADHPCAVGLPPHEREVSELIGGADLLIAVGTGFDGPNTRNWTMPLPPALLTINCDPTDLDQNFRPTAAVLADAKLALAALVEVVGKRADSLAYLESLRTAGWARLRREPGTEEPSLLLDAVNGAVARHDAVVVADMAIPGYWVGGYGRFGAPRRLQYPVGWGTLGYALPASIGVGALRARPALAVCGDGGFMFAVGELAVLRQERLPVTVLLVDDGGYGMLRYDQTHVGDPHRGVDLGRPDFAALAAAFGITSVTLDGVDGRLGPALDEALAAGEPRLVLVRASMTPPRTTSPRWADPYLD